MDNNTINETNVVLSIIVIMIWMERKARIYRGKKNVHTIYTYMYSFVVASVDLFKIKARTPTRLTNEQTNSSLLARMHAKTSTYIYIHVKIHLPRFVRDLTFN